jgi:6-phosphogluconolactonase
MDPTRSPRSTLLRLGVGIAATVGIALGSTGAAGASSAERGHVLLISNEVAGNHLVVLDRAADGSLGTPESIPTGGTGTGSGLGSQGAVTISDDGRWAVAVNPGSDDVSLFSISKGDIALVDTESSGGDLPISADIDEDVVYVLNAGADNGVSGLRVTAGGLEPIAGSTQMLSAADAGGAQVSFTPDGDHLVVTEKNTNVISTFPVDDGVAGAGIANESTGVTPFGFSFGRGDVLLVSNANGGAVDASSLSSYDVADDGTLVALDGPDSTNQTAACWVAVSKNGKWAYTTNTGSASVTGFEVGNDGSLDLLDADGVTGAAGQGPTDVDLSDNGRFLYTLGSRDDTITIHRLGDDGALTLVGTTTGIPATAVGLAAS